MTEPTLSDRAFRVAIHGVVPEDDQSIIADMMAEIDRLRAAVRPSWDADEWQRAITCVAEQLAMFRNPDDPPPPNENDVCAAGHIVGALLGQEFVALRGFVRVDGQ